MKYRVEVTETINHTYIIEADSEEEARNEYQNLDMWQLKGYDLDGQSCWDSYPWEIEETTDELTIKDAENVIHQANWQRATTNNS